VCGFLSPARSARGCEVTKFFSFFSLILKRQCGGLACGEREERERRQS